MIALVSDHGGFPLKEKIKQHLDETHTPYRDYGPYDGGPVDYPEMVSIPCADLLAGRAAKGIFICGTGIGISIAANKHPGIRAACCGEGFSVRLAREHNDANVLCLGGRILAPDYAFELIDLFLSTPFSNGERHSRRIRLIHEIENQPRP